MKNNNYKYIARKLRKNMTFAERLLWNIIRKKGLGIKFRRQESIGKYIVDFVSYDKKLIIEIDGGQHNENKTDIIREKYLNNMGFKIIRYWNNEVINNIRGVLSDIEKHIKEQ